MAAGFTMNLMPATSEPISNSGIRSLRRVKKVLCDSNGSQRESSENKWQQQPCRHTKAVQECKEVLQAPKQRSLCSPWCQHGEAAVPLHTQGVPQWSRDPPAGPGAPHARAGNVWWGLLSHGAPARAGGRLMGAVMPWEVKQALSGCMALWREESMVVQVCCQDLCLCRGATLEQLFEGCIETPCWSRDECKASPPKRKQLWRQYEMNLPQPSFPVLLCHWWGAEKSKAKLGKNGGGRKVIVRFFFFTSHYAILIWLVIN